MFVVEKNFKKVDYIGIWFYLGSLYVSKTRSRFAFVSTNSICQGEMVVPLWKPILDLNVKICFAHTSFKWSNNAKHNAGVYCVIVGIADIAYTIGVKLYIDGKARIVDNINP